MPGTDLATNDPLLALNFFLEIDGAIVTMLSEVSGLDIEVEVGTTQQVGKNGQSMIVKTVANQQKPTDLTLKRLAPAVVTDDPMWKWFNDIRDKGMKIGDRSSSRKNGSVVIYDSTNTEVGRFNFYNAWPSKIATDGFSVGSNEPINETITLVNERLERIK